LKGYRRPELIGHKNYKASKRGQSLKNSGGRQKKNVEAAKKKKVETILNVIRRSAWTSRKVWYARSN